MSISIATSGPTKQQSKRFSCDRCRTQKLKCVRPDPSGACQRCSAAETHCSFDNHPLPGRQPGLQRTAESSNYDGLPTSANFWQNEMLPPNLPQDFPEYRSNIQPTRRLTLSGPIDPNDIVHSRTQMGGSGSQNSFNILDNAAVADLDVPMSGQQYFTPSNSTRSIDEAAWEHQLNQINNSGSSNMRDLRQTDVSGFTTGQGSSAPRPDVALTTTNMALAHTSLNEMPTSAANEQRDSVTGMEYGQRPHFSELDSQAGSKQAGQSTPILATPSRNVSVTLNQKMQQLMQLGTLMCDIQTIYSHDEHAVQVISSDSFPTDFAGKVLDVAVSFLKTLNTFYSDDYQLPSASTTGASSNYYHNPVHVYQDNTDTRDYTSQSSFSSRRHSLDLMSGMSTPTYISSSSSNTTQSTPSIVRRVHAADKPAVLQLISCYLRFLQLYNQLYTSIHGYIRSTNNSSRCRRPIWGGLSLGGASLSTFADFQIKFVLQVTAHLLSEVEAALGLSEGCRVSRKTAAEGSGVLGASVTAQFIEMSMADVSTGTISKLRDLMERVMGLLDASIRI